MNALLPRPCAPDLNMPRPAAETPEGRVLCLAFVLLPGFDMLALMAGTEPFRLAERLGRRGTFRILLLSADRAPVLSAQGVTMSVDGGISDAVEADITLVVGGEAAKASLPSVLTGHLRRIWRQGKRVGAVHGGIFALARAGILGGHRFAAHCDHLPVLAAHWPELTPVATLYCMDRRIVTCAGGIAMADLSLRLIHDSVGQSLAHEAMHACLVTAPRSEDTPQTASAHRASRPAIPACTAPCSGSNRISPIPTACRKRSRRPAPLPVSCKGCSASTLACARSSIWPKSG